jgi:hypothetical protein
VKNYYDLSTRGITQNHGNLKRRLTGTWLSWYHIALADMVHCSKICPWPLHGPTVRWHAGIPGC